MKDSEEQQKIDGLKDVFEELREADSSALPLVKDAIEHIRSKNFQTGLGAASDVVTPRDKDPEARRKMQRILPMLPDSGLLNPSRRELLRAAVRAAGTATIGTASGIVGTLIALEVNKPDAFEDSFVRQVLRLHSNRRALKQWRDELKSVGRTDECQFIEAVAAHGDGFWEADQAMAWIEDVRTEERLSGFTRKYLEINHANHHRYLGQIREAFDLMATFEPFDTTDLQLNALILNQKYMNRHLLLGSVEDFRIEVPHMNQSLAVEMRDKLDIDAASLSIESFRSAEQISVECLCLKGWFFMNQCISASSENEAMSALEVIDRYRALLVRNFVKPAFDSGDEWMAIRLFGEAIINYARVAPVAWVNGWSNVLSRCFSAFFSMEAVTDVTEQSAMREYHEIEGRELRSPLWIQMALVRTMANEVMDGSGARTLVQLLPAAERYDIRHHTVLQRTLDALRIAFGRDPNTVSDLNALVSIDETLMRTCVQEMLHRRGDRYPL